MPRYALKIEYHGAPFNGWQRQVDQPTVQGAIEAALSKLEQGAHTIAAAGRTDTGVHGLAQVAHCDMARDWRPFRLGEALNYHLKPQPIAITDCVLAPEDFHARFSALERRYHFRILSRRAPAVHQAGLVWQIKHGLDVEAMQAAADLLVGKHDFTTFRSTVCQAESPVKTLDRLQVSQVETMAGTEYHFDVRARSFLHNQVRSVADMGAALAAKDRAACGPVCPPQGLYLAHVSYPVDPFAKV